jgi:hypothetical protein
MKIINNSGKVFADLGRLGAEERLSRRALQPRSRASIPSSNTFTGLRRRPSGPRATRT